MATVKKYRMCANGFTLLEIMIVIAIVSLLATIAIPNFISYRDKAFCTRVESQALGVASAVSNYYGIGAHTGLPKVGDLNVKPDPATSVSILGDPNNTISIVVLDKSGRCPKTYMKAHPLWNEKTKSFTKYIK